MTPAWIAAPRLIAYVVGMVLLVGGAGLFIPRTARESAAGAGVVLLLLTAFFYVPIFILETEGKGPDAHAGGELHLRLQE